MLLPSIDVGFDVSIFLLAWTFDGSTMTAPSPIWFTRVRDIRIGTTLGSTRATHFSPHDTAGMFGA